MSTDTLGRGLRFPLVTRDGDAARDFAERVQAGMGRAINAALGRRQGRGG